MKSKSLITLVLVAFIVSASLTSCKSRCHCPTFSKQVSKVQTTLAVS